MLRQGRARSRDRGPWHPGPASGAGTDWSDLGTITDATGGVLPGVTITIRNVGTGLTRETVTGTDGAFAFPDLLAGTFDLTVTMQGFKTYEQKGIELGSTERVGLRTIALDVGGTVGNGHGAIRSGAGADAPTARARG